MEEEDAILGLTLQMPSVNGENGGHDSQDGVHDMEGGWEAFEAAMDAAKQEMGHQEGEGAAPSENKDDSDDDDGGNEGDTGAAADGVSDEQLLAMAADKKAAKKLGKSLYKRWKKLQKKREGGKDRKKKDKKSDKKRERKRKAERPEKAKKKSSAPDTKRAKRDREPGEVENGFGSGDDDDPFAINEADFLAATRDAASRGRRLENTVQRMQKQGKKSLTAEQRFAKAEETAKKLVADMRDAQAKDEILLDSGAANKQPPLNRIAMKHTLQAMCARRSLIGPLIDAGLLVELSKWLYDLERGEPAPYELRTTALDILLNIPLEGELENGKDRKRDVDLTQFTGLSREELQPTNLRRAVNALRLHQQETSGNRSKCVRLLERLSQAYTGRSAAMASSSTSASAAQGVVSWKCKGDTTVRSPFDVVQTGSQSFQQAFMKPDPLDPTSYNNLLPWRPPVRSITNLSGNLGKSNERPL